MDTRESKRFNPDGARSHCLRWRSFIGNGMPPHHPRHRTPLMSRRPTTPRVFA